MFEIINYTCMQNWDGTGENGAALRHFEATGSKYPLVVKLGTITPHGADVFSYAPDENDMVEDPKLVRQWIPCSVMWTGTGHAIEQPCATSEHAQKNVARHYCHACDSNGGIQRIVFIFVHLSDATGTNTLTAAHACLMCLLHASTRTLR